MNWSSKNKLEPYLVTLVNVLARASHLLFFLAIGNRYGATVLTDTVLYLQAPLMVLMAVVAGAVDAVVMPIFHRADGKNTAKYLFRFAVKRIVSFTLPLSTVILIVFSVLRGHWDFILTGLLLPIPLLGSLAALKAGVLNASNRFKAALLGPLFGGMLSVPYVLFSTPDPYSLAICFLLFELGKLLGISFFEDLTKGGLPKKTSLGDRITRWGAGNARWQIVGSFFLSMTLLIDIWFAANLDTGSVTFVEYANKLWNVVPLLFVGHIAMTYSSFSRSANGLTVNNMKYIHQIALRYGFIACIASMLFIFASGNIINMLYQFGGLSANEQQNLAGLLRYYLLGAGPYVCSLIYVKFFSATGLVRILALVAGFGMVMNIIGDALFIRYFGLNGIGMATSTVYLCNSLLLVYFYCKYKNKQLLEV